MYSVFWYRITKNIYFDNRERDKPQGFTHHTRTYKKKYKRNNNMGKCKLLLLFKEILSVKYLLLTTLLLEQKLIDYKFGSL